MLNLVLWRHAEAHADSPDGSDLSRALTARGARQAARVAAWLDRQLPDGARILCSPALRARQTADALGRSYTMHPELAPDASAQALLELAQWPAARGTVLIVGHQPTLGLALAHLLPAGVAPVPVRKGALWWLRSRERAGERQTVVVAVQSPQTV